VPGQPSTDPLVPHAFIANLPNILTGVRLVLVPVFLVLLLCHFGDQELTWTIRS
jgi:CDP-diacylglycerol--glycerol-3-phosphate 3-phosphatidyltransferase